MRFVAISEREEARLACGQGCYECKCMHISSKNNSTPTPGNNIFYFLFLPIQVTNSLLGCLTNIFGKMLQTLPNLFSFGIELTKSTNHLS